MTIRIDNPSVGGGTTYTHPTTGGVSATAPITVTASRQVHGGAMVIAMNTANLYVGTLTLGTYQGLLAGTGGTVFSIGSTGGAGQVLTADGDNTYSWASLTTATHNAVTIDTGGSDGGLSVDAEQVLSLALATTGILGVSAPLNTDTTRYVFGGALNLSLSSITTLNTKSFHVYYPANAATYNVWKVPADVTLKAVHCMVKGGTSVTGALYEADANGINCTTATVAAAIVAGNDTASNLVNATIDSADYINWITTATSGAVTGFTCTIDYVV